MRPAQKSKTPDINKCVKTASKKLRILTNHTKSFAPVLCRLLSINENCGDTSPLFYVTPCAKTPDINKYVKTASKKLLILTNHTKSFLSPVLVGAVIGRPLHSTDSGVRSPQECPCTKTPNINKYVKTASKKLLILTNRTKSFISPCL